MKSNCSLSGRIFVLTLLVALFQSAYLYAFSLPDPVIKNFTDNNNGTVTCNDTGLTWEVKGGAGTLNDAAKTYSWTQAKIYIAQLNATEFAGYSDWRLPTIKELGYIATFSISPPQPNIDITFFPNTLPAQYWSSTPFAENAEMAWYFCFNDASRKYSGTDDRFYVRAVREVN